LAETNEEEAHPAFASNKSFRLIKGNECKRSTRQRYALAAFADLGWLTSTVCLHWVGGIAGPAGIRRRFRG